MIFAPMNEARSYLQNCADQEEKREKRKKKKTLLHACKIALSVGWTIYSSRSLRYNFGKILQ